MNIDERFKDLCEDFDGTVIDENGMLVCELRDWDYFKSFSTWMKKKIPRKKIKKEYVAKFKSYGVIPETEAEFIIGVTGDMEAKVSAIDIVSHEAILDGLEEEAKEKGIENVEDVIDRAIEEWENKYPKNVKPSKYQFVGEITIDVDFDSVYDNWELSATARKKVLEGEELNHTLNAMDEEVTRAVENIEYPHIEGD